VAARAGLTAAEDVLVDVAAAAAPDAACAGAEVCAALPPALLLGAKMPAVRLMGDMSCEKRPLVFGVPTGMKAGDDGNWCTIGDPATGGDEPTTEPDSSPDLRPVGMGSELLEGGCDMMQHRD
jgi:hypothetical protein